MALYTLVTCLPIFDGLRFLAFMDGAAREPVAVGETVGVLRTRHGLEAVFLLGSEERLADSCVLSKLKRGGAIV